VLDQQWIPVYKSWRLNKDIMVRYRDLINLKQQQNMGKLKLKYGEEVTMFHRLRYLLMMKDTREMILDIQVSIVQAYL
jgi:bisphosphoglycerate-dependent phosphoglycerate mutase